MNLTSDFMRSTAALESLKTSSALSNDSAAAYENKHGLQLILACGKGRLGLEGWPRACFGFPGPGSLGISCRRLACKSPQRASQPVNCRDFTRSAAANIKAQIMKVSELSLSRWFAVHAARLSTNMCDAPSGLNLERSTLVTLIKSPINSHLCDWIAENPRRYQFVGRTAIRRGKSRRLR